MKTPRHFLAVFLFSLVLSVCGAEGPEYRDDPYLRYRPAFARSLPVQVMLTGVVLTLVAVLFIHLMFTAQYHWPLAPVNYVLQLSGVTTLLISLIATIHVVLSTTFAESEKWPYMLNYIAVNVPPDLETSNSLESWSVAERATWLVMNASTSGLIQITHIQFLTLLYPSRLEGRLIFALLGPLAILAAIMQLLPISSNPDVTQLASDVRNVCNATLSLLFTLALFIWGLLVNRRQAWRTDGGTAVFGCAALMLAVVSTALNFLYVHREEEFVWLPSLMWAVVLWQSFLGWWWWVGAGSNRGGAFGVHGEGMMSGEEEDEEERRRERREAKRERRRREKAERGGRGVRAQRMWRGVAGAFGGETGMTSALRRVGTESGVERRVGRHEEENDYDDDNMSSLTVTASNGDRSTNTHASSTTHTTSSRTSSNTNTTTNTNTNTTSSTQTQTTMTTVLPQFLPPIIHRWYGLLRREHNEATRVQAEERVQRMRAAAAGGSVGVGVVGLTGDVGSGGGGGDEGDQGQGGEGADSAKRDVNGRQVDPGAAVVGWGWGWYGFGWRWGTPGVNEGGNGRTGSGRGRWSEKSASPSASRSRSGGLDQSRSRSWIGGSGTGTGMGEYEMQDARHRRGGGSERQGRREREEEDDGGIYVSDDNVEEEEEEGGEEPYSQSRGRGAQYINSQTQTPTQAALPPPVVAPQQPAVQGANGGNSIWWWGPLKKWRLQDSTTY